MAIAFEYLVKTSKGETHIAGRRITAYDVLAQHKLRRTPEDIAAGYDLPLPAVYEALAYALQHAGEMQRGCSRRSSPATN